MYINELIGPFGNWMEPQCTTSIVHDTFTEDIHWLRHIEKPPRNENTGHNETIVLSPKEGQL